MELTERQQQAQRQLQSMSATHQNTLRNSPGYVLALIDSGAIEGSAATEGAASPGTGPASGGHGWGDIAAKFRSQADE